MIEWTMKRALKKSNKPLVMIGGHSHLPYFKSLPMFNGHENELKKSSESKSSTDLEKLKIKEYLEAVERNSRQPFRMKYRTLIEDPPPLYFNSGCCTGNGMISAVEIENGEIRMVEWDKDGKKVIYKGNLQDIFNYIIAERNGI